MPLFENLVNPDCPNCRRLLALVRQQGRLLAEQNQRLAEQAQALAALEERLAVVEQQAHRQAAPFRRPEKKRKTDKRPPGRPPGHPATPAVTANRPTTSTSASPSSCRAARSVPAR